MKLWFDLSSMYSGACGSQPISTLTARLFYLSSELDAQDPITNLWTPHSGSFAGFVSLTAQPGDAPDQDSTGFNKWSQLVYTDIVRDGFTGTSWSMQQLASVQLNVQSGVASGTVGLQLEAFCGGTAHFLPSALSVHTMQFTTSWDSIVNPPTRRLLGEWVSPPRRLSEAVEYGVGDITGDGLITVADVDRLNEYLNTPPDYSVMNATELRWIDLNGDGTYTA